MLEKVTRLEKHLQEKRFKKTSFLTEEVRASAEHVLTDFIKTTMEFEVFINPAPKQSMNLSVSAPSFLLKQIITREDKFG